MEIKADSVERAKGVLAYNSLTKRKRSDIFL